ncbi:DNA polymerase III subunit chi [Mycoavidus sp. B2-EB]|uniref:DNA polymerase III subunit chi n=1 Tax=Mycoavidus sp. B2-EB TaxID=2651972 RepID=UPI001628305B|nr:DNA polymerase III subunit chi [Mycoavidus sp. B2-EB]BBO59903.1 DNA polymerase III subunit chi [Mycoavidus sp. B2-EB]
MTQIDFHTHVGDQLDYACRLVRKVYAAGQSLLVLAEPALLRVFDAQLWTFSALEFIPHCMADDALCAVTPIVLATQAKPALYGRVLLNLGTVAAPDFAHFTRVLEVVGSGANELAAARERYRFYREQGYQPNTYKRGD